MSEIGGVSVNINLDSNNPNINFQSFNRSSFESQDINSNEFLKEIQQHLAQDAQSSVSFDKLYVAETADAFQVFSVSPSIGVNTFQAEAARMFDQRQQASLMYDAPFGSGNKVVGDGYNVDTEKYDQGYAQIWEFDAAKDGQSFELNGLHFELFNIAQQELAVG